MMASAKYSSAFLSPHFFSGPALLSPFLLCIFIPLHRHFLSTLRKLVLCSNSRLQGEQKFLGTRLGTLSPRGHIGRDPPGTSSWELREKGMNVQPQSFINPFMRQKPLIPPPPYTAAPSILSNRLFAGCVQSITYAKENTPMGTIPAPETPENTSLALSKDWLCS